MSTDLHLISGICLRFIKTCQRVKNRAKIVQWELGIKLPYQCTLRVSQGRGKVFYVGGAVGGGGGVVNFCV